MWHPIIRMKYSIVKMNYMIVEMNYLIIEIKIIDRTNQTKNET